MNKRILSVILTLIMLVSLVPAGAIHASAAGLSVSESAITILKQLEGYSKYCTNGYTGYGTLCTKTGSHANHVTTEKEADAALREELADLSAAVNTFASRNGLSLTQSKHDALVLFSFENGTAWTTGTGDFQTAVKSGMTGTEFLSAICHWDRSTSDDLRRMIEANMYLNGVYSSSKPSQFIRVDFDLNAGSEIMCMFDENGDPVFDENDELVMVEVSENVYMSEELFQYYDLTDDNAVTLLPSNTYHYFLGWYTDPETGYQVTSLTSGNHGDTLYAHWQGIGDEPGIVNADYDMTTDTQIALYDTPNGEKTGITVKGALHVDMEYVDTYGVKWVSVDTAQKVYFDGEKVKESANTRPTIDLSDFVAEEWREAWDEWVEENNISTEVTFTFWVKVGELTYETGNADTTGVIATATITSPVNGYVNVRSDAGTDNQIVGALSYKTTVNLYEIKYVNGIAWGRYSGGWFCLSYANVTMLDDDNSYLSDSGFLSYVFTGTLNTSRWAQAQNLIHVLPDDDSETLATLQKIDDSVVITNLTADDEGNTWGQITEGWVKVTNADGTVANVTLDVAKFYTVVDGVTVRQKPSTSATRVNNLVKGVEFNVNERYQVMVVGDTIWGYADKVGENNDTYSGWINLASKYVARGDAPILDVETEGDEYTGKIGTIVGADKVNVRIHHATYSKVLGKIARGTKVTILEEVDGWYKIDYDVDNNSETDSWVVNTYVEVSEASTSTGSTTGSTSGTTTVETGLGIVANTYTGVNVRTAPGTGNAAVGKILAGTTVEILEVTTYGSSKWGRVSQGWVCMDYITMITNYEILDALTGNTTGSTSSSSSEVAIYTGTTTQQVNIRKSTSLNADIVRTVEAGSTITLHEILTVTTTETSDPTYNENGNSSTTTTTTTTSYWARVNDGYIYNPQQHIALDTLDEATYTVTESATLNVRSGAGTNYGIVYILSKGDQVTVTQVKIVNGAVWGYIEADTEKITYTDEEGNESNLFDWDGEGWISLAHCTKGAVKVATESTGSTTNNNTTTTTTPVIGAGSSTGGYVTNTSGYRYTGKVINTNEVNVRATASTSASITTTLKSGAALVIYETTIAENMAWGRCDAGWVYLYYVDLTPVVGGAVDARVVYNENTIAYTDMNCSSVAGTYARMSVIDIYEIVGKMARTELGWVNVDNLL